MKTRLLLSLAFLGAGVAACGSGSTHAGAAGNAGVPSAPETSLGKTSARFSVRLPAVVAKRPVASLVNRLPKYVAPGTNGLAIKAALADGSITDAAWQLFDISSSTSNCATQLDGSRICNVTASAPIPSSGGSDEFQIVAYDVAPDPGDTAPSGAPLSAADLTQVVTSNAANPIAATLFPIAGSLSAEQSRYSVWAAPGQHATLTVNVIADDADGNLIASATPEPFATPITFGDNANSSSPYSYPVLATPAAAVSPGVITANITYNAPASGTPPPSTTVTAVSGAPLYAIGLNPLSESFVITPMTLSASSVSLTPGGPLASITVSESGASDEYVASLSAASPAPGPTLLTTDASGTPTTSFMPNGSGVAVIYLQATTSTPVNATSAILTITDALGTQATAAVSVNSSTTAGITIPLCSLRSRQC